MLKNIKNKYFKFGIYTTILIVALFFILPFILIFLPSGDKRTIVSFYDWQEHKYYVLYHVDYFLAPSGYILKSEDKITSTEIYRINDNEKNYFHPKCIDKIEKKRNNITLHNDKDSLEILW